MYIPCRRGGIHASSLWGSLGLTPIKNFLRPDLLDVLLLEPGGSKFFKETFGNLISRVQEEQFSERRVKRFGHVDFFFFYRPPGSIL